MAFIAAVLAIGSAHAAHSALMWPSYVLAAVGGWMIWGGRGTQADVLYGGRIRLFVIAASVAVIALTW